MKKYFYLVSYHFADGYISGFGDTEIESNNPITTYAHTAELRNHIKERNKNTEAFKAVILNLILLRTEEVE